MDVVITEKGILNTTEYSAEMLNSDHSVYEVIRIIDGIALFLEDHFARLTSSLQIRGFQFEMDISEFKFKISELIKLNHRQNGNVKFVFSLDGDEFRWVFAFIPHSYPDPEVYLLGVSTNLHFAERENPNAKVIQNMVRQGANQMIADQELYEVLLVDRKGMITEGSRSNVFLVKDEVFYTAPASSILAGITRLKVLECLKELGYSITEKAVHVNEINLFDAVFLTGTSPKVLPVNAIGKQLFNTQLTCVKKLIDYYNNKIDQYIKSEKYS